MKQYSEKNADMKGKEQEIEKEKVRKSSEDWFGEVGLSAFNVVPSKKSKFKIFDLTLIKNFNLSSNIR